LSKIDDDLLTPGEIIRAGLPAEANIVILPINHRFGVVGRKPAFPPTLITDVQRAAATDSRLLGVTEIKQLPYGTCQRREE
jgi:hypothetical protein